MREAISFGLLGAGLAVALGACGGALSDNGGADAGAFDAAHDGAVVLADGAGDTGQLPDVAPPEDATPPQDTADAAVAADADDAAGEVDDIAASFSASGNPTPTGHFQYGSTPTLGGVFVLYASLAASQGMPFWQTTNAPNTPPYVAKNTTNATVLFGGTATIPAGTLWFHPGPVGDYSVIRWTCPKSGSYAVNVTFTARDETTSDVAILKNGVPPGLFAGNVTTAASPSYTGTLALSAGDILDFAVGYGSNGTYYQDSTGIDGTISAQ